MGIFALLLLVFPCFCLGPGLLLLAWGSGSDEGSGLSVSRGLLGLAGALALGLLGHLVPYVLHAGDTLYVWSLVFEVGIWVVGALAGVAAVLAGLAFWRKARALGALSGAVFLAAALQPLLLLACSRFLRDLFAIQQHY